MGLSKGPILGFLAFCLSLVACVGAYDATRVFPTAVSNSVPERSFMGGGALGGNADTTYLTRLRLEEIPESSWAWVTHRMELEAGEKITHRHKPAFVYSIEGMHDLMAAGTNRVREGQALSVRSEIEHSHRASFGPTVFWETRLDRPGSTPAGFEAETVFESPVLEDIPENPLVVFIPVEIPPGGETSVHSHPGPEFIYQMSGGIDYQNDIIGVRKMVAGDVEGLPPLTAVQKRNPSDEQAVFLSWFLVDTEKDFASPAAFRDAGLGQNLALLENGASVAGVSSNFGSGGNDSAFGAANALDGDPATEWSSASDGDAVWIDVELAAMTNVTSVGFWTRTMGDTAQVNSFQVTTGQGETYGPFTVDDATTIYRFETQFTARRLQFELLDTSGGNTGALEIEVYGEVAR